MRFICAWFTIHFGVYLGSTLGGFWVYLGSVSDLFRECLGITLLYIVFFWGDVLFRVDSGFMCYIMRLRVYLPY